MADVAYERILLVKPEVFIYQIPPRASNRAVRASEWDLPNPNWKGRMRIVAKADNCSIKLEDRISGELFAECPVDAHPGVAVEAVSDSSRYFILRLLDSSGRHAFVGLGFEDRGDAFDFNVSLQDHFKKVKQSQEFAEEETKPVVHKDYSLKAGEKIQIKLGKSPEGASSSKSKKTVAGGGSGGMVLPPPPSNIARPLNPPPSKQQQQQPTKDEWGDFTTFGTSDDGSSGTSSSSGGNWVQF